jgi:RES domain
MMRRGKHLQRPPTRPSRPGLLPGTPSLIELERFSEQGLQQWRHGWSSYRDLYTELYFGFESQRAQHAHELTGALLANAGPAVTIEGWGRIVDYQYCLSPLSVTGSLSAEGGRFNIGKRLNVAVFSPFPALYVGDSLETAYAEKFSIRSDEARDGLTAGELVLRAPPSFTYVKLEGLVELCIDIGSVSALRDIASVMMKFRMPERALQLARSIHMVPPAMVRSATMLREQLLHPNWNTLPLHFDLPSNSQIFGRLAAAAGFHGIRYPSVRHPAGMCLALFPQNWKSSGSRVQITDKQPAGARLIAFDGSTTVFE